MVQVPHLVATEFGVDEIGITFLSYQLRKVQAAPESIPRRLLGLTILRLLLVLPRVFIIH